jgi:hypothetical protein
MADEPEVKTELVRRRSSQTISQRDQDRSTDDADYSALAYPSFAMVPVEAGIYRLNRVKR